MNKKYFKEGFVLLLEKKVVKKLLIKDDAESPAESFKVKFKDGEEINVGEGDPEFTVLINGSLDKKSLMENTSLALGEAYMDKAIDIEGDLFKAINVAMSKFHEFVSDSALLKKKRGLSKKAQKEQVRSHYDIGNNFYKLWLDDSMNYSCAYFEDSEETLYDAQRNKVDYIIKKLQLEDGMSLLDIGCGWGDLLIAAAKKHRINGVGITLSEEQYNGFKKRIKQEGLEDYLDVKLMDYRDLKDSGLLFDRVVSVGMIEHVGRENYDLFFENIKDILKDKGIFLLHFISGLREGDGDPWIHKYIFPGGIIPSLREVIYLSVEKNFHVIDVESLRQHYVKTLLYWYDNFNKEINTIEEMFDERFVRMWKMYLIACAALFNNGYLNLHQIVFSKGVNNKIPMTRHQLYK